MMAWKLNIQPWEMLDLTPPELEGAVQLVNKLLKTPNV